MASRPVIECYFSFISSWSYIGSRRLQLLARENNAQIIYKPIDLMHLFSISGGLPVKERAVQRQAYRLVEMERWCKIRKMPIVQHPKFYPVDPSLAHRVLLAAIKENGYDSRSVWEFARRGSETVWAREEDISDGETICKIAKASGLHGTRLLKRAKEDNHIVEQERYLTLEAESRQVFGAPFYFYGDEPFWGQDRLEILEDVIRRNRR